MECVSQIWAARYITQVLILVALTPKGGVFAILVSNFQFLFSFYKGRDIRRRGAPEVWGAAKPVEPAGAPKAPKAPEEEAGAAAEEDEGIAKLSPLPNGVAAAPALEMITAP